MDEVMQGILGNEDVVTCGDMNGHIGSERRRYKKMNGRYNFKERNETGKIVLDFALSYDLAVVYTYFRKREEHYITYKSGDNKSQIDYLLWKRETVKRILDLI